MRRAVCDNGAMTTHPRHLACAQYCVIALMMLNSWYALLMPIDGVLRTLRVLFHPDFPLRNFFIGSAGVTVAAVLLTVLYATPLARRRKVAAALFVVGLAMFGAALRLFEVTMVLINLSGCALALWAWRRPDLVVFGDDVATPQDKPGEVR
jgi:hypothetical protein